MPIIKEFQKGELVLTKGEKVRIARNMKGISQEAVATELGIKQQAYRKLENGKTILTETRFEEIAKIIKMDSKNIRDLDKLPVFQAETVQNCNQVGNFLYDFDKERALYENRIADLEKDRDYWKSKCEESSLIETSNRPEGGISQV